MKNIKQDERLGPKFLEPTESEIYKARQAVINKYGVELSSDDAIRFARLFNELNWWIDIKNDPDTTAQIVDELIGSSKEIEQKDCDQKITEEKSTDCAKVFLDKAAEIEKKRIGDEMSAIINSNTKN